MKKKLLFLTMLFGGLLSSAALSAGIKVICHNEASYEVDFEVTSNFCPPQKMVVAAGKEGVIEVGDLCGIQRVKIGYITADINLLLSWVNPQHYYYKSVEGKPTLETPTPLLIIRKH